MLDGSEGGKYTDVEDVHNKELGWRLSFEKEGLFKTYTDVEGYRHNGLVSTNLGAPIRSLRNGSR